jgi:hypothetical protein
VRSGGGGKVCFCLGSGRGLNIISRGWGKICYFTLLSAKNKLLNIGPGEGGYCHSFLEGKVYDKTVFHPVTSEDTIWKSLISSVKIWPGLLDFYWIIDVHVP